MPPSGRPFSCTIFSPVYSTYLFTLVVTPAMINYIDENSLANSCVEIFTNETNRNSNATIGTLLPHLTLYNLLPPLSSTLFLSPGHYKTRDDFSSLDDYARYVKNNIAVGLTVRCCESYRKVRLGDIGRVTKVGPRRHQESDKSILMSSWETLGELQSMPGRHQENDKYTLYNEVEVSMIYETEDRNLILHTPQRSKRVV